MTPDELQTIEAELQKRGYRKFTHSLTSTESWAWFKTFHRIRDRYGDVIDSYQIAFRVWNWRSHKDSNTPEHGLDFWTAATGAGCRMDFTANWEPICDIDAFERLAADFNALVRSHIPT